MKLPEKLWRYGFEATAFMGLYILLDWASYLSPLAGLNITPWNPAPALGLVYVIRRGWKACPILWAAIIISDVLVRAIPGSWGITLLLDSLLTLGYTLLAYLLMRHIQDGRLFSTLRSFFRWAMWIGLGSMLIAWLYVSTLVMIGLLPKGNWMTGVVRFWLGDSVGIFIAMPLFWLLTDTVGRTQFLRAIINLETVGHSFFTLLALGAVFVFGATMDRYFYVLFLPLVWAASRQGLMGAVFSISVLQVGMLLVGFTQDLSGISLFELQARALVLALIGFIIGVVIDEQRRISADLRQTSRLIVAGEMAGALAHEVNQPLTALSAYTSACLKLIGHPEKQAQLREVFQRLANEVHRLSNIIRRLRDFFRTGAMQLELVSLPDLLKVVCSQFEAKACESGILFKVENVPNIKLLLDGLQIEVVLRNLLMNAFESVADGSRLAPPPAVEPTITLACHRTTHKLFIDVMDNGAGIAADFSDRIFEPFASSKSSGLGLGLAISRAIAEAHGGSLTMIPLQASTQHGCRFRLELPMEGSEENSNE